MSTADEWKQATERRNEEERRGLERKVDAIDKGMHRLDKYVALVVLVVFGLGFWCWVLWTADKDQYIENLNVKNALDQLDRKLQ